MKYTQLNIFDFINIDTEQTAEQTVSDSEKKQRATGNNIRSLEDWALLYTCGSSGKSSMPRFMMTLEDAQAWCSSELSHGILHGHPWAYFYTSLHNYFSNWNSEYNASAEQKGGLLDMRKIEDNGKWDGKIKSLGLRKYNKYEMQTILSQYGCKVLI